MSGCAELSPSNALANGTWPLSSSESMNASASLAGVLLLSAMHGSYYGRARLSHAPN